jgi:hypothetical protein
MMRPGWYIYTIARRHQRDTVRELREAGFDVIWLFCFANTLRAHRTVKRRRPDLHRPVPALWEHVFVKIDSDTDESTIADLDHGVRRMPMPSGDGLAPRLSAKGVAWLENPPGELMFDTDVDNIQRAARAGKQHLKVGDRIGVLTYPFTGKKGQVVSITGDQAQVHFDGSFFDMTVPVEQAVKIA